MNQDLEIILIDFKIVESASFSEVVSWKVKRQSKLPHMFKCRFHSLSSPALMTQGQEIFR